MCVMLESEVREILGLFILFCGILLFWVLSDDIGEVLYCCELLRFGFLGLRSSSARSSTRPRKVAEGERGEHTPRASPDARPEQS